MRFPLLMAKKIVFLLLIIMGLQGCTRDDICPEGTATTPKMIIVFKDNLNRDIRKEVEGLSIMTDYEDSRLALSTTTTDSIALPLSTTSDTTKYLFIRTRGTTENPETNIDKVMFIYSRGDIYVNRACGFKAKFYDLEANLEEEGTGNWIQDILINRDSITDENKAHLTFFH